MKSELSLQYIKLKWTKRNAFGILTYLYLLSQACKNIESMSKIDTCKNISVDTA